MSRIHDPVSMYNGATQTSKGILNSIDKFP